MPRFHGLLLLAAGLALASCQPLPHPFQTVHTMPAPGDLLAPGPETGLTVAPLQGAPPGVAQVLSALVAHGLRQRDIPASSRSVQGSYLVQGEAQATPTAGGMSRVTLRWTLIGPTGLTGGSTHQSATLATAAWQQGDERALAGLADRAAADIARLALQNDGGEQTAAGGGRIPLPNETPRFLIQKIDGAPGDGDQALAQAIGAALGLNGLRVVAPPAPGAYRLSAHVQTAPAGQDEIVSIAWTLRTSDGRVLGTVNQNNHVARSQIEHAWGSVAYLAALGAADGLMQLVESNGGL